VIRVTFADGATEDREDDSDCYPDAHANFVSTLHINRGADVRVKVGVDEWRLCYVETCEEQIARLTAERDEAHQKYVLRDAHALLWKGWAREFLRQRDAESQRADRWRADYDHKQEEWSSSCDILAAERDVEKARADAAEKRLLQVDACVVCEAALLPPDEPPHCVDCCPTEEHEAEWERRCRGGKDGESK
jgi:hypothetical protein